MDETITKTPESKLDDGKNSTEFLILCQEDEFDTIKGTVDELETDLKKKGVVLIFDYSQNRKDSLAKLQSIQYDLLWIDARIPLSDEKPKRIEEAGIEYLPDLQAGKYGELNINTPFIVVSDQMPLTDSLYVNNEAFLGEFVKGGSDTTLINNTIHNYLLKKGIIESINKEDNTFYYNGFSIFLDTKNQYKDDFLRDNDNAKNVFVNNMPCTDVIYFELETYSDDENLSVNLMESKTQFPFEFYSDEITSIEDISFLTIFSNGTSHSFYMEIDEEDESSKKSFVIENHLFFIDPEINSTDHFIKLRSSGILYGIKE